MIQFPKITHDDVAVGIEACRKKAAEIDVPMDIAVVDESGLLLSLNEWTERLSGAFRLL